ncbi:MAG TPA: hemerythrin domain-containing protein [Byssovorax sp.]
MTHLVTSEIRATRPTSLRAALMEDHRETHAAAMRVAQCFDADDSHGALAEWPAFERGLLEHMNAEEMHVLPRFAEIDPDEARALRDEHAVIRRELGDLGVALELHVARKSTLDALVARVWRHAEREDELMYAWAERSLPERVRDALLRRLGAR